ncbi:unnamed protein product, partial [Rotaria sp. Silwood2]
SVRKRNGGEILQVCTASGGFFAMYVVNLCDAIIIVPE